MGNNGMIAKWRDVPQEYWGIKIHMIQPNINAYQRKIVATYDMIK